MRLYKVGMSVFCNSFGARAGRLANSRSLQLFQNLRQQTRGRRNHDLSRGRRRASSRGAMNVFDRTAKRRQKNRAYASPDAQTYDYIRNEVASQIVDRVCDVARYFPLALDMGCGRSHIATATTSDVMGCLVQCDMAENALLSRSPSSSSPRVPVDGAVVDEEHCSLPFSDNTFDLIMSSLSLHWVNDLPGALKVILCLFI
jgi:NADH dehydrogenase [ubiquinone] 1 alpha subcomplex assembly factor 5